MEAAKRYRPLSYLENMGEREIAKGKHKPLSEARKELDKRFMRARKAADSDD